MSAWQSQDDAKAADEAASRWVAENLDAQIVTSVLGDFAWLESERSTPAGRRLGHAPLQRPVAAVWW